MRRRAIGSAIAALIASLIPVKTASSGPQHVIFVRTRVEYPFLVPLDGHVQSAVVPPRLGSAQSLRVQTQDSEGVVLAEYKRFDLRVHTPERGAYAPLPSGTERLVSSAIVAGSRWLRIYSRDALVMEYDMGPDLVAACTNGTLPPSLCGTFDSDGDGCADAMDDNPLVSETVAPSLSVTLDSGILWPPNHRLVAISATASASDNCTDDVEIWLDSITSSDPETGITNGDTGPDIVNAAIGQFDTSFALRAERWGQARTYSVTYAARDRAGNVARATAIVRVPLNRNSVQP